MFLRHNPAYSCTVFFLIKRMNIVQEKQSIQKWIIAFKIKAINIYEYCICDVWNETKSTWIVNLIKTINLSVRSFLDKNLQLKSCALTYSTLLAIVPALALIFAIGRGFGFSKLLQSELFKYLPSQTEALKTALSFVDSYLAQSSQGLFLGIGIVFLLWTLISLMSNVEDAFNHVWGVKKGRSIYRKITDYTVIFIMLPILMVCASGISIFMSAIVESTERLNFLTPVVATILDIAPFVLTWLFFTGTFMLIPYAKVKFKYAFISGILCGTAFQIIQLLFVAGQIYVSKYNAIYGSFAFLPLLLIWLQLTWLICLSGVVLTYSSQNIFQFNFSDNIDEISQRYQDEITIIILAIIIKRFEKAQIPYTKAEISEAYSIPIRLVNSVVDRLCDSGILSTTITKNDTEYAFQPAVDINMITVGYVYRKLRSLGKSNFIPRFSNEFEAALQITNNLTEKAYSLRDCVEVKNIPIELKEIKISHKIIRFNK